VSPDKIATLYVAVMLHASTFQCIQDFNASATVDIKETQPLDAFYHQVKKVRLMG